jgi:hypothetical protein
MLGMEGGACARCLFFCFGRIVCVMHVRVGTRTCRAERWKDCSDDHALSICWNRACFHSFHRPSCPCLSWFVVDVITPLGRHPLWSSLVETHFNLQSISSALHPPPLASCREGHRFDPALNQQSTTKVRALALLRALHARDPFVSSRIGRQSLSPSPIRTFEHNHCGERQTHTHGGTPSCHYSADLELPPLARRACATSPLCR